MYFTADNRIYSDGPMVAAIYDLAIPRKRVRRRLIAVETKTQLFFFCFPSKTTDVASWHLFCSFVLAILQRIFSNFFKN